jgi:hypothetical protein
MALQKRRLEVLPRPIICAAFAAFFQQLCRSHSAVSGILHSVGLHFLAFGVERAEEPPPATAALQLQCNKIYYIDVMAR